jgi:hypothetical protein
MEWKPRPSRGGWIGLALLGGLSLIDILVMGVFAGTSAPPVRFLSVFLAMLSLPVLGLIAYWTYGFFTLRYHLDRNGLVIRWGGDRQIVPIGRIQAITRTPDAGERVASHAQDAPGDGVLSSFRGVAWPGYRVGQGQLVGAGPTLFRSTTPLEDSLLVMTPSLAYVISPADSGGFIKAWEVRKSLGPTQSWTQEAQPVSWLAIPFWSDRLAYGLIIAALVAGAAFAAYVWACYPALPERLPFHFNAAGQVDRVGSKGEILRLPTSGLLLLLVNLLLGLALHKRERLAAYLAWGGAIAVQILLWLAAVALMG